MATERPYLMSPEHHHDFLQYLIAQCLCWCCFPLILLVLFLKEPFSFIIYWKMFKAVASFFCTTVWTHIQNPVNKNSTFNQLTAKNFSKKSPIRFAKSPAFKRRFQTFLQYFNTWDFDYYFWLFSVSCIGCLCPIWNCFVWTSTENMAVDSVFFS